MRSSAVDDRVQALLDRALQGDVEVKAEEMVYLCMEILNHRSHACRTSRPMKPVAPADGWASGSSSPIEAPATHCDRAGECPQFSGRLPLKAVGG